MAWRTDSLEANLSAVFIACLLLQLAGCSLLLTVLPVWQVVLLALALGSLLGLLFRGLSRKISASFDRTSLQLDALQAEDYAVRAKPPYAFGKVAELQRQLNALTESLQRRKSGRDQHSRLLYRLIDQLNTPILIFDQKLQLSYANQAFSNLFGRPWETMRHASPALLDLIEEPEWHFADPRKAQWQIRHSSFLDEGQNHQLLVFINIQAALRESQVQAWQKLIQVISHEIRNSLTPVVALVQNLRTRAGTEREQQILDLINERCQYLQDFVKRYAKLHEPLALKPEWLRADDVFERLHTLFPDSDLQVTGRYARIWADAMLLQQVLINLIKNALEAGSSRGTIRVAFGNREQYTEIRVVDSGHGIASPDNLFVPFYSTKPQGQGIGLSLSRHFVEQMGGQLSLSGNTDGVGACALIHLPKPTREAAATTETA